jgi:hypothetical protein
MSELELKKEEQTIPFFPDHVGSELKVIGGLTALVLLVGVLGLLFPVGLGDPADPMVTPDHVKPEWYFLALYQVLKFVPKTAGVVVPLLIGVLLLTIWPFIDRKPEASKRVQRFRLILIADRGGAVRGIDSLGRGELTMEKLSRRSFLKYAGKLLTVGGADSSLRTGGRLFLPSEAGRDAFRSLCWSGR